MRQLLFVSLLVLAGCVSNDEFGLENPQVKLIPNSNGSFTYVSYGNKKYPADDENAELKRLSGMVDRLKQNGYCPGGWDIPNGGRRMVKKSEDFTEVYHTITCR